MVLLSDLTTTDAKTAFEDVEVAVIATGSTEQHGPALPLGTDSITAEAFARTLVERDDVVILPTIPIGVSGHHRQFDGTLWTSSDVFEKYLYDIIDSIASHGLKKTVVVNGHGGNTDAIHRAAEDLRDNHIAFTACWSSWEGDVAALIEELLNTSVVHADAPESSIMLHIAEELVREDNFEEAENGNSISWGTNHHGGTIGYNTIDFTETGATGHPTDASPEIGKQIFEAASQELDKFIDWLIVQDLEDLWSSTREMYDR